MNQANLQELVVELSKAQDAKGNQLMTEDFRDLVARGLHHVHLPAAMHPKAAEALQAAFEGMGGLPRLLLWADAHPAHFYKLFARMVIPTIQPVLPTPQTQKDEWPEWLTARRMAYQEAGFRPSTADDTDAMDNLED